MANAPRRALLILAITLSAVVLVAQNPPTALAPESPAASEEAALHALADQFYAAYPRKDLAAITALWSSKSPDLAAQRKSVEQFFAANDKIEIRSVSVQRLQMEGEKAHLRVGFEMSALEVKSGNPTPDLGQMLQNVDCVREAGAWKLWRRVDAAEDFAASIVKVADDSQRNQELQSEKDLLTPKFFRALLRSGRTERGQGNLSQAEAIFRTFLEAAKLANDQRAISSAWSNLAIVQDIGGNHRVALQYFEEALKVAQAIGDKKLIGPKLADVGSAYRGMNDLDQALDYYSRALEIVRETQDGTAIQGILSNMGDVYQQLGRTDKALASYDEALKVKAEGWDASTGNAALLTNIGALYKSQGNYSLAMEYFRKALDTLGPGGEKYAIRTLLNDIGQIYDSQGDFPLAMEYYQKGLKLAQSMNDQAGIGTFLEDIGAVEQARGLYPDALRDFRKSLAISEKQEEKEGVAALLNNIGEAELLLGHVQEALEAHKNALALAESLKIQQDIAASATDLADVYLKQRKFEEALAVSERAEEAARQISSLDLLWMAQEHAGLSYRGLGQPEQAHKAFDEAIAAVEQMRTRVAGGGEQQQNFLSSRLSPYYDMVALSYTIKQPAQALAYAERAKGRVLLDVLQSGKEQITKAMTPAERDQEEHLQARLVSLNKQVEQENSASTPDAPRLTDLKSRIEAARLQYNDLQTALFVAHPELKVQRGEMQPVSPQDALQLLPDSKSALLEYVAAEDKTYLLVLTGKCQDGRQVPDLEIHEIPASEKQLARSAERFRRQLSLRDLTFQPAARSLFQLLVKPAARQLAGKKELIIVPDGPLWNLPFQALLSDRGRYLLEDYAVGYAPSLTVLQEMIRLQQRRSTEPAPAPSTLLAMGNPAVGKETRDRVHLTFRDASLAPLPEAEAEVRTLGKLYGSSQSQVYVGAQAREDRFKAEAGNARLLHLAAHGFLDDASPMYSHIVLASSEGNAQEDGLLETREIMQLDLKADLAVLSACETARGHVSAGEGVIGLAWAFFVAGTPTTIVSQWKVESSSTTQLMTAFHRARKANLGQATPSFATARALREAELQLLHSKQYAHPFYWASFVEVGNPN